MRHDQPLPAGGAKIFFIGVTQFGLTCFRKLQAMGCNIIGCAYTGEKLIVRRQQEGMVNVTHVDFEAICREEHITGVHFDKQNPLPFEEQVIELSPDLIVVAGFHYLISSRIISLPRLGVIGLHASLLPKYRGSSPLVWQLINGETESGLSMFYIGQGADTGDIIGQERFVVLETDTIRDLIAKSEEAALRLLDEYIPRLIAGTAPRIQQNEAEATYFKQRIPSDGEIDWSDSPRNIQNFIRAQTKPYPGAFTYINGKKIIIWDADIIEE